MELLPGSNGVLTIDEVAARSMQIVHLLREGSIYFRDAAQAYRALADHIDEHGRQPTEPQPNET